MRLRTLVASVGSVVLLAGGSLVALAPPASSGLGGDPVPFEEDGQYEVPEGVCQVAIAAWGGIGGDGEQGQGGQAGRIAATFLVNGGDVLDVYIAAPGSPFDDGGFGGTGYADGGDAGQNDDNGGGGGGSTAVVRGSEALIVAGGGGGGGRSFDEGFDGTGGDGGLGGLFSDGDGQDGEPGTDGGDFGVGGAGNDPTTVGNQAASPDGDGASTTDDAGGGGAGGAGSLPGGASDAVGGGGGGGSGVSASSVIGPTDDPGSIKSSDGFVLITPGLPGEGCPSTLEVAKVVSGPSTTGFTIKVECTADIEVPKSVSAAATTLAATLPYDKTGAPVASQAFGGWKVADGAWVFVDDDQVVLPDATCTATETDSGGADSVSYGCSWTEGAVEADPTSGCPGATGGPSASPQSVTFAGGADVGRLTVTNTFAAAVSPNFTG